MCEHGWGQRIIKGLEDHNHHNLHLHDINFSYNIHLQGIFWPYGMIFHKPRLPWNTRIYCTKPPFKVRSCEVAIIWPGLYISTTLQETNRHSHGKSTMLDGIYPDFDAGFPWAKMWVSREGVPRLPPGFPTKISDSHGPFPTPLTRSSLHWERLSAISSDAACAGRGGGDRANVEEFFPT